ncbi:hypothetical protein OHC33_008207 [Knufia fluminis]|uniref:Cystathionine gamma-synthase n=2 Tax=Knufia TaxID=430999 RepID=A0AAN8I3X5_9EURO|nr:hypothetical protein OHC33_008207 [Knufia fluminis]
MDQIEPDPAALTNQSNTHTNGTTLPTRHQQPPPSNHPPQPTTPHQPYSPSTLSIHADDPLNLHTDVAPPLHVSTTFRYATDPSQLRPFRSTTRPTAPHFPFQETPHEHCYSRLTTPSTSRLETILSSLLHAPSITYSSGLSALHALLTHLVPKRVSIGAGYHGCHGVLNLHVRLSGTQILPLDCDADDLQPGDLICLETPINPTGLASDISSYAKKAHSRGAYLLVDSTFAPPPLQDPFVHGADIVMHSGTKYIGGHSDMLCGVLAIRHGLAESTAEGQDLPSGQKYREGWMSRLLEDREFIGAVMGGLEGWLGVRSLRTLELRVIRQSESATSIVRELHGALNSDFDGVYTATLSADDRKVVKKVLRGVQHASLQTRELQEGWLKKQMAGGFGAVFAMGLNGEQLAKYLPSKLRLFHHATSLGGVESLIEWRTMSDATVATDLLRVSIGVEDWRDLLGDIVQGFRGLVEEFKL